MRPSSKQFRVLVVDDDLASRELLEAFLKLQGFEVETAADGNRAIEMTGRFEYDLVILDVQMPVYTGVEVLRLLRKQHIRHRVPILALTGDTSERTRQALVRDGIDAVLSKPVDFKALRAELGRLLS